MKVFHGTTTSKMHSIYAGDFSKRFGGLYVTDTYERAAMYANSQADHEVTQDTKLHSCAVVFVIETENDVNWLRRPDTHPTLDKCETTIQRGRIVEAFVGTPAKNSYTAHDDVRVLQELGIPVTMLEHYDPAFERLLKGGRS